MFNSIRAADTYVKSRNGRRVEPIDFQAIILCGQGESLYPLTQGESALPKALLPIGDEVMIDRVLTWIEKSGIIDVLLLCPDAQVPMIAEHVRNSWLPAIQGQQDSSTSGGQRGLPAQKGHSSTKVESISIAVHGLSERAENDTAGGEGQNQGTSANAPGKGVKNDQDGGRDGGVQLIGLGDPAAAGTGRILRRWKDWIRTDFVVLPCDLTPPPKLPLSQMLVQHRNQAASLVTSLWFEKSDTELKDPDSQESVLLAYDQGSEELLLVKRLEALEDDLTLRMSLLSQHPNLTITTALQDAHVYVFRKSAMDLICTREVKDLESIREDIIPWLVKGGWQPSLRLKWEDALKSRYDPLAAAFERSTASPKKESHLHRDGSTSAMNSAYATLPSSPRGIQGSALVDFKSSLKPGSDGYKTDSGESQLKCRMIIVKAPAPPPVITGKSGKAVTAQPFAVEQPLIRGNTVAGYWALCREFLRTMPPNLSNLARQAPEDGIIPNIDPKAQVSADSLISSTSRVGERTSIKKSIIGRHCVIGKNVRISNAVIWDFVNISDGAKIDGSILCSNVRVGDKAQIQGSEIGCGYEIDSDETIKSERLVLGDDN